jgi:hypothetical protein
MKVLEMITPICVFDLPFFPSKALARYPPKAFLTFDLLMIKAC